MAMTKMMTFKNLNLSPMILQVIAELEFSEPTLIQQESIPIILKGKDLIGEAKTGSGKTAAFGFPIIQKLKPNTKKMVNGTEIEIK